MYLRGLSFSLSCLHRAATVRERRRSSKLYFARPATLPDGRGSVYHIVSSLISACNPAISRIAISAILTFTYPPGASSMMFLLEDSIDQQNVLSQNVFLTTASNHSTKILHDNQLSQKTFPHLSLF